MTKQYASSDTLIQFKKKEKKRENKINRFSVQWQLSRVLIVSFIPLLFINLGDIGISQPYMAN